MDTSPSSRPLLLLFGGSFNPPHVGHMRIAVETAEILAPVRTLFIPCATPPHKSDSTLLPFDLRCELLRAAFADMTTADAERFEISGVEREREGPSYTIDTLMILAERFPEMRPAFVMGSEDYSRLDTWRAWQDLPEYADLVILPRNAVGLEFFNKASTAFWPEAEPIAPPEPGVRSAFALPHGGRLLYLSQPTLEISSSLARRRYREKRSLDFLLPPGVIRVLRDNDVLVDDCWRSES